MSKVLAHIGLIMLIISGSTGTVYGQRDFVQTDIQTYRLFTEQKWDSLLLTGNKALREGVDFYYLRVRMGIACFEQGKYFPAVRHLKTARGQNPSDSYVNYYLYYSLRYTNQSEEAELILAALPPETREKIEQKRKWADLVYVSGGYTFSSALPTDRKGTLMKHDSVYGEEDLYGDNTYFGAGWNLRPARRLSFQIQYIYLGFTRQRFHQWSRGEYQLTAVRDTSWGKEYVYSFPQMVYDTSYQYRVNQHEFHLGANLAAGSGIRIMPAIHLVRVGFPLTRASYRFDTIDLPAYYTNTDSTIHTFSFPLLTYTFPTRDTSFTNYVASLRITKDAGLFSAGISGSYANLNGNIQKQIGASVTFFPAGNLNYYSSTFVTGFFQNREKRLLISQILGAKLTSWLWAEASFHYGDHTNANIFNGSVVYNNSDRIRYRCGASMLFVVSPQLQLSLTWQLAGKESIQYYYIKVMDPSASSIREVRTTTYNPYQTQSIFGGITWKLQKK